ncbi:SDR family oxidoreductase [Streptomyces albiaxialis]|uniref:SDR family oxidoreductase n=1 Tax=Streptomyces albiaxialis TaxID=329523 RepID=A0ABP5HMV5_9ACTN
MVVVTGASAGVGRAAARAFGARGDAVALLARGEEGLERATAEVRDAGGEALPLPVDVADAAAVDEAAARAERELGPLDVWVNAAFSTVFSPVSEATPEEFRRTAEVTYLGTVHGTMAALRRMLPRDRGTVVQAGSALAYRGVPLQAAYCAAKHAVQGFHESLRCELLHERSRVRTTMVQLPGLDTPQFGWVRNHLPRVPRPVPPVYAPEVAARALVFAADHPRRREFWIGGSTVATLLGDRFAPGLLDRYLARTGYGTQQTDAVPSPAQREGNLWRPADAEPGQDHGAHGAFGGEAHRHGAQPLASRHHALLAVAACGAAGGAAVGGRALVRGLLRRRAAVHPG